MTDKFSSHNETEKKPSELSITQLAMAVRAVQETYPDNSELLAEAANKLEQLQNMNMLLGLLAPGGTAPRTALEEICNQSGSSAEEFPALLELRKMLATHWGEWTPALREAAGFSAVE